jgi:hypothetical protein
MQQLHLTTVRRVPSCFHCGDPTFPTSFSSRMHQLLCFTSLDGKGHQQAAAAVPGDVTSLPFLPLVVGRKGLPQLETNNLCDTVH